jgi:hypothetical protein
LKMRMPKMLGEETCPSAINHYSDSVARTRQPTAWAITQVTKSQVSRTVVYGIIISCSVLYVEGMRKEKFIRSFDEKVWRLVPLDRLCWPYCWWHINSWLITSQFSTFFFIYPMRDLQPCIAAEDET